MLVRLVWVGLVKVAELKACESHAVIALFFVDVLSFVLFVGALDCFDCLNDCATISLKSKFFEIQGLKTVNICLANATNLVFELRVANVQAELE
jgi:hypothetical protein